jgi:inner membrane protein
VETRDFFQMMPVNSLAGEVDPKGAAFIRYKPEETPATLAAKKSRLGRVYLDWAGFPVVEAQRMSEGGGYLVHFADLRFYGSSVLGRRATTPLQAYVILDSQLNVVEEGMGRAPGESSAKEKVD